MNVQIAYGNSNSVTVEADENLLPYIETTVENGKLSIKSKKNVNLKSSSKMNVYVSMTKINSLQLSGSGNINGSEHLPMMQKQILQYQVQEILH